MVLFQIGFLTITLIDLIDLLLVSWLFFKVYIYFKGTRAGQMLAGLIFLMLSSFLFVFSVFTFSCVRVFRSIGIFLFLFFLNNILFFCLCAVFGAG